MDKLTFHVDEAHTLKPRSSEIFEAVFICIGLGDPRLDYDAPRMVSTTTACQNDIT